MRKQLLQVLFLAATGVWLVSGCVVYSHHAAMHGPGAVVVTENPPPPQTEVIGTPPDEAHVWVSGYWTYSDNHWVWIPGHWELRPHSGATWVPGHWDKNPDSRGWIWTPGHWD